MILLRDDFLGLQYFEYCPQEMAPNVIPCLALMFKNRELAFSSFALLLTSARAMRSTVEGVVEQTHRTQPSTNSGKTPKACRRRSRSIGTSHPGVGEPCEQKGKITISFTSEADGDYELRCMTSLGPGVCGGIQPELVHRFLEILAIAPFYIVTCGYFPNTGEVGGRAGDEYILAKEGIMILKNKVTIDGKEYFSFDTPENVASYAEDFRKFVTKDFQ